MSVVTIRPAVDAEELQTVEPLAEAVDEGIDASTDEVFPQSVASGGPTPTGIVLWTRIAPAVYDPNQPFRLAVASDPSLEDVLLRREFEGPGVKPSDNYTLRVDLEGFLAPDTVYYYRFDYGGVQTRTGRCRTLPAEDASPDSLRLGLLNCQNYQNGYFGAMAHLAETDVDFVLHLGDYVYEHVAEGPPNGEDGPFADRVIQLPHGAELSDGEQSPATVHDFRRIYETYKADPHLKRLHERHTVVQTWDDHAIANDRYWDYEADAPVFPEHPLGDDPEFTRSLTEAGIQAWWEFIPARITYEPEAEHIHDTFELYQSVRFGDLVTLLLTDERLYRSEPLSPVEKLPFRRRRDDPSRTMLGAAQRDWFLDTLRAGDSLWTVWANAVLFHSLTLGRRWLTPWSDSWDGYAAERAEIVRTFDDCRRREATDVVTLTGDMHTTLATRIRSGDPDAAPVAIEFMTPGVSSVNFREKVAELVTEKLGLDLPSRLVGRYAPGALGALLRRLNADFEFFDSAHWGYSVIEFTRDDCTWDVYWVDKTENAHDAECVPTYRARVPLGEYVVQDRSDEVVAGSAEAS